MRTRPVLAMSLFGLVSSTMLCGQSAQRSDLVNFQLVEVADGFERPWSITFLPAGDMLVTEKAGRLRIVRDGVLLPDPVTGTPPVATRGQAGMLDVVLHPDYGDNQLIYISYSKIREDGGATTAVGRGRYQDGAIEGFEDVFVAESRGNGHYGSRIVFDNEGYMFVTIGDRQASPSGDLEAHPAQDLSNHAGTVVRLHDDGRIPSDNPFVGRDGALSSIWSYGHRNQQGMAYDPATGNLWATEHGPRGGDELNLVRPGLNYGWPVIGFGINYNGTTIHASSSRSGMEQPEHYWVPSIATSGTMFYTGDVFPEWRGNIFVGGMAGEQLARLTLDGTTVTGEETLIEGFGRIRDVKQGPDGYIYLVIDNSRGGRTPIVRLEPNSGE